MSTYPRGSENTGKRGEGGSAATTKDDHRTKSVLDGEEKIGEKSQKKGKQDRRTKAEAPDTKHGSNGADRPTGLNRTSRGAAYRLPAALSMNAATPLCTDHVPALTNMQ